MRVLRNLDRHLLGRRTLSRLSGWIGAGMSIAVLGSLLMAGPVTARDVVGDDERDMFVGTGSLILPVGISRPGRASAADCPGCEWKATLTCDPVSPTACRGQARLCPNDHLWLRISLRRPGADWQVVGSQCFTPGGPARRDHVESQINDIVQRSVPPLRPTHRPPRGIVTQLPVMFDSGQKAGPLSWTWSLVGLDVSVQANPSWAWQFDQSDAIFRTSRPGGPRPAEAITHTYRQHGLRQVSVETTWTASYYVGDLGPLTVSQPVRQQQRLPLSIGQARAVLIR